MLPGFCGTRGGGVCLFYTEMIQHIIEIVMDSPAGTELAGKLKGPDVRVRVTGIAGSLDAVVVAGLYRQLLRQVFVLCPDHERAGRLADDLGACLGGETVILYGGKEHRTRHPGGSDDARALRALTAGEPVAVIAIAPALTETLPPPATVSARTFRLQRGESYAFKDLIRRMGETGFLQRDLVDETGDFAFRGGILDIFPFGVENPVRLEFFGDTIESIREFDPVSQRSIRPLDGVLILPDLKQSPTPESVSESATLPDYFAAGTLAVIFDSPCVVSVLAATLGTSPEDAAPATLL